MGRRRQLNGHRAGVGTEVVGVDGATPGFSVYCPPTKNRSFSVEAEFERIVRARKL